MLNKVFVLVMSISLLFSCRSQDDRITATPELEKGKLTKSITINGNLRDYILYIPESYSGDEAFPLLFAFHGLGGNMNSSYDNSKFHLLAERENFIVVHPNGSSSNWDAVRTNNNADLNFIEQLINQLENDYNIESSRIYSTGMSNGGYFSFLLACKLSDKIAAIGSVTGLMFRTVATNCAPTRPVPILQIHGTEDQVVDYSGVNSVLTKWVGYNHTNLIPTREIIPNTNLTDGSTVERFTYKNGDRGSEVQHLKIIGGEHQWPGYQGNMDINASEEVWNFVKQYDLNGRIN